MTRPVADALWSIWVYLLVATPVIAQPATVVPVAGTAAAGRNTAAAPPDAVHAPFRLTLAEQKYVDEVLVTWERETKQIGTFKVKFEQWKYVPAMGFVALPQQKNPGELSFVKPDKGSFEIKEVRRFDGNNEDPKWVPSKNEVPERWVCDGKAVYQFDQRAKELKVLKIDPELQGKAIANGPLPFLFGQEAKKLKARYWVRVTQSNQADIWLEIFPKLQADAANYRRVEVILDRKKLLPTAMQVDIPGGDRDVYLFALEDARINHPLDKLLPFRAPLTPFGWKKKYIDAPQPPPAGNPPQLGRQIGPGGTRRR